MADYAKLARKTLEKAEQLRLASLVLSCDWSDPRAITVFNDAHKAFGTSSFPELAAACEGLLRKANPEAAKAAEAAKKYRAIRNAVSATEADVLALRNKVIVGVVNSLLAEKFSVRLSTVERARRRPGSPPDPLDEFLSDDLPPGFASLFRQS